MKRVAILLVAWALLLSLLSANADAADVCTSPVDYRPMSGLLAANNAVGGIGGTGHAQDGNTSIGGIGGTGHTAGDLTSIGGIGGTGRAVDPGDGGGIGGTGIIGTITGFASICVNGLEVHYEDSVPVSDNGVPVRTQQLAIGQVVVVEAGNSARGLEAKRIAVVHALEGPVTRAGDGQLAVMGARVALASDLARQQAKGLGVGDWVQVSGHPAADGGVLASHVGRIEARSEASASGRADPATGQVGGVAVDHRASGELTVRGKWDGRQLKVRESRPAAGTEWTNRPARVVIETRVRQVDGKTVHTGRADVDAALGEQSASDKLGVGTLIRMTGRIDADGKLRAVRIERAERDRRDQRDNTEPTVKPPSGGGNDGTEGKSGKDINNGSKPLKVEPGEQKSGRSGRDDAERTQPTEKTDKTDRSGKTEKIERLDRNERTERIERPERLERDH